MKLEPFQAGMFPDPNRNTGVHFPLANLVYEILLLQNHACYQTWTVKIFSTV